MTDKRFVVKKYSIRDMSIDEKYVNSSYYIGDKGIAQRLCDLLNEQHETIQRLKQNIDELLSVDIEEELVKENEQLKQEIETLQEQIAHFDIGDARYD